MARVFELEVCAIDKLLLLAMADHARDDGTGCYPSLRKLAQKTSLSRRSVWGHLQHLKAAGLIVCTGGISGYGTIEYALTFPQEGVHGVHGGSANECSQGVHGVHPNQRLNREVLKPTAQLPFPQAGYHQQRYAIVGRLAGAAEELLIAGQKIPGYGRADLAEDLKKFAAERGIRYFDALAGRDGIIEKAIAIAEQRQRGARRAS
jgi:biotin operon repressor